MMTSVSYAAPDHLFSTNKEARAVSPAGRDLISSFAPDAADSEQESENHQKDRPSATPEFP